MIKNSHQIPPILGSALRQLRKRKGLSLKELADKAGTSAAAVHRYESGWDRFEMRTLQRLAAALEARLDILLDPVEPSRAIVTAETLTAQIAPLFWDADLAISDLQDYSQWVLRRVLQYGSWNDVHQARKYFGDAAVLAAAKHRSMDTRTRRLWQLILEPKE